MGVACFCLFCLLLWGYIKRIQYDLKDTPAQEPELSEDATEVQFKKPDDNG